MSRTTVESNLASLMRVTSVALVLLEKELKRKSRAKVLLGHSKRRW